MRRNVQRLLVAAVAAWAVAAWASAVDVKITPKVMLGKGMPRVLIQILEPIHGFHLELQRNDGQKVDVKGGGKPGVTRVIELHQPEGHFAYEGMLTVETKDGGKGTMPLKFETDLVGPLKMEARREDVDLEARKATFRLSRPGARVHVKVVMDTGNVAMDEDVPLHHEPANTPITVTWPRADGRVMLIGITAYDDFGFYSGVELSPWRVDVPHEEVLFDTGKDGIRTDQRGKLDTSYAAISEVVRKSGKLAPIQLFIVGHTDTVGDAGSNRQLSLRRARSIGAYFRKKGLRIPIYYEGVGEEALAVGTRDETDEPRNRRAEYILSIEEPVERGVSFKLVWHPL